MSRAASPALPASDRLDMRSEMRAGLIFGVGAYLLWGLLPVYFKLLDGVDQGEIVAQRAIWSLGLMLVVALATPARAEFLRILHNPRMLGVLAASATAIATNWTTYIYAIAHGHILAASLGYFMSPLLNVLLGRLVFKEHMSRRQGIAVGVAALGVGLLAIGALDTMWMSLMIAGTWGTYSMIRKLTPVGAVAGLTVETIVLMPFALGYLAWLHGQGGVAFGQSMSTTTLLMLSGVVTSVPLLLFAGAARRMPLSVLGLLQYLAPTTQFLLSVLAYGEPLKASQLACFVLIWAALGLFSYDMVRQSRS